MPTMLSHPAVAIGLLPWFRQIAEYRAILLTGMALAILPDIDVVGFKLGVPYGHLFGHRGFSHSLFAALLLGGVMAWWLCRTRDIPFKTTWLYLFICMASHGVLDAMTNGGLGIAFLSPFSNERFFLPFQPIKVSSLTVQHFFGQHGLNVLSSELIWIWLPVLPIFLAGMYLRRQSNRLVYDETG
ncbi:MAG: metal-dependent hydrolase [Gammaproteobacteria bacterium]|nr:metal-dependent hydrolase [Gammaproteobacteria bacterium]MDH5651029.1 metal-dependent hydrolase [Gammaproteobacteria bacterium]